MIVETVGIGQSEMTVASMVDFFLVLMLAGAGDELQGIKKGFLELADALAINKADGDNRERAGIAQKDYETALHLLRPASPNWSPPVLMCSARERTGIEEIWAVVLKHREVMTASGELAERPQKSVPGLDVVSGGRGAEGPVQPSPGSSATPAAIGKTSGERPVASNSGRLSITLFS